MKLTLKELNTILDESFDLTHAQVEILVENRIEYIKNAFKDKISTAHDPDSGKLSSDKIIDTISSKIDPTARKTHTEWLLNRYHAGEFKLGDAKEVKKTMKQYEEAAPHMENKDMKSFKSMSQLKDNIATTNIKQSNQEKPSTDGSEAGEEKIYDEDGVQGFKLKSKATSIRNYGPNGKIAKTKWCTAAEGSNNMYSGYDGGKYPMRFPNGAVLQINHQSSQIKNEQNQEADIDSPKYAPYKSHISKFVKQTAAAEGLGEKSSIHRRIVYSTPEELQSKIDDHTSAMHDFVQHENMKATNKYHSIPWTVSKKVADTKLALMGTVSNTEMTDDQLSHLSALPTIDDYSDKHKTIDLGEYILDNKHITPNQVSTLTDKFIAENPNTKEPGEALTHDHVETMQSLLKHNNIPSDSIHKLIGWSHADHPASPASYDARNVIFGKTPNANEEHFARMNPTISDKEFMIERGRSNHIPEQYYKDVSHSNPDAVAENVNTPAHILDELTDKHINDDNIDVKRKLTANPNISKPSLMKLAGTKHSEPLPIPMRQTLERNDMEPSDRSLIVKHYNEDNIKDQPYNNTWVDSNRLSRDDIHSLMRGPKFKNVQHGLISNPKMRHGDFEEMIKHPEFQRAWMSNILSNPYIRPSTIDALSHLGTMTHSTSEVSENISNSKSPAIMSKHITNVLAAPENKFHTKAAALSHPANVPSHFEMFKNNPRYHGAITNSKNAPPSILHELSSSPLEHVRQNIAENPNTEQKTMKILSTDSNPTIAAIAKKKTK